MERHTLEDPCILTSIVAKLDIPDIVSLKLVSKDGRFNDVLDRRIEEIYDQKTVVISELRRHFGRLSHLRGKQQRIPVFVQIYDLLYENPWVLRCQTLRNLMHVKLLELSRFPPFREQAFGYYKLFGS